MDEAAKKAILRHFLRCTPSPWRTTANHGMTANWLTQAAFEPPMVVVAIENSSKTIGMIRDSHHFAINLFLTGQRDLAGKLGRSSEQAPQKLKGIKTKPAPVSGTPVMADALGWVECRVMATLPAGDLRWCSAR
jgi:flavin reductase (DIM6/NTAB) family NADH-FMN oxidoreductase RutF